MRRRRLFSLFSMLLPLCQSLNEVVFSENQAWNFEITFDADGNAHYTAMNSDGSAPYHLQVEPGGGGCSFSYNESLPNGPSHWKDLCGIEWQPCGMYRQSPVDLLSEKAKKKDTLAFKEQYDATTDGAVENNRHTLVAIVRVANEGGRTQRLTGGPLGDDYELLQFHYHTPSEHLLEGVEYPLEIHLVHKSLTNPNDYAVLGFMFDISRDYKSPVLEDLMKASKQMESSNRTSISWTIPLADALLPKDQTNEYFNYLGSLTTPPCSEVVNWFVMTTPLHASPEQLDYFRNLLGVNSRPVLDIGNRVVTLYTPPMETIYHGKLPPGAIAGITLLLLFLFFGVIAYFVFSVKHTRVYFLGKDTGWNYVGLKNGFIKKGPPIEAQDEGSEDDDAPVQRKRTKGMRESGTELAALEESDRGGKQKRSDEADSDEDTRPRRETTKEERRGKGDLEDGGIGGKKQQRKVEDDDDDYIPPAKKTTAKSSHKGERRGS
eukprot:TRINITY_DN983_c0_g1_i7.p1 TRINITY_DN983_c0_g1~~TRINITY_DN983_c0_g1_i7.p1  ORF type:complete len:490 (+),score=50.75 TRINITY_DN983_c0_g1_i7:105-1574(+)